MNSRYLVICWKLLKYGVENCEEAFGLLWNFKDLQIASDRTTVLEDT